MKRLHSREMGRLRRRLYKEQQNRCAKCGLLFLLREMEVHHVQPLAEGGTHDDDNVQLWCLDDHHEATRYQNTDPAIRDQKRDWRVFLRTEEQRIFRRVRA